MTLTRGSAGALIFQTATAPAGGVERATMGSPAPTMPRPAEQRVQQEQGGAQPAQRS